MEGLLFKCRGSQSPQGKPRVYFISHPEDFSLYFEETVTELLALVNCAIYYRKPEGVIPTSEEMEEELSQMQLIVIPVTKKLLTSTDPLIEHVNLYAERENIPMLLLMQEPLPEHLFSKKFGRRQYLNRHSQDDTEISYQEKLNRFLTTVLIGDELADQIRKAFDSYIFLSYRKKNRRYAQELMKLIHDVPFCRDIAIWYDEFLTPGEDFSEAIAEALNKSSLFALAVTPDIVNEKNYVMQVEYPMAVKQGKLIVPFQMAKTSPLGLKLHFRGLGKPVDVEDRDVLSEVMRENLKKLAICENDRDPQHNFFIGLAYLGGIDVEVAPQRALELIQDAAVAGFVPAMEKLVDLFRTGNAVSIDIDKSMEWQNRLVEIAEEAYKAVGNLENGMVFCRRLRCLGQLEEEAFRLDEAERTYQRCLDLGRRLAVQVQDSEVRRMVAEILMELEKLAEKRGNRQEALSRMEEAMGRIDTLWQMEPDAQNEMLYRTGALRYNALLAEDSEWDGPLANHDLLEKDPADFTELKEKRMLRDTGIRYAERNLRDLELMERSVEEKVYPAAEDVLQRMLTLSREIVDESRMFRDKYRLAEVMLLQVKIWAVFGKHIQAMKVCHSVLAWVKEEKEKGDNSDLDQLIGRVKTVLAGLLAAEGDMEGALAAAKEALTVLEPLYQFLPQPERALDLAECYSVLWEVDISAPDSYIQRGIELWEKYGRYVEKLKILERRGDLNRRRKHYTEAAVCYEEAMAVVVKNDMLEGHCESNRGQRMFEWGRKFLQLRKEGDYEAASEARAHYYAENRIFWTGQGIHNGLRLTAFRCLMKLLRIELEVGYYEPKLFIDRFFFSSPVNGSVPEYQWMYNDSNHETREEVSGISLERIQHLLGYYPDVLFYDIGMLSKRLQAEWQMLLGDFKRRNRRTSFTGDTGTAEDNYRCMLELSLTLYRETGSKQDERFVALARSRLDA